VGYWLDGNITKPGITADLESMKASGIGGFSFMDCGLGNPPGPHRFMSDSWREMFRFMLAEAGRLGLKVDLNDAPGWAGSGGPWIRPEQAAQRVIVGETVVDGGAHFSAALAVPPGVSQDFYRDIVVLAYPISGGRPTYRIPEFDSTKSFSGVRDFAGVVPWPRIIPTHAEWPTVPDDQSVKSAAMVDLTARFVAGRLTWDAPPGKWLVLRFGHTIANGGIRAGQPEAQGLECDKLSPAGIDAQFAGMVAKLAQDVGDLTGQTLVSAHVDSWESGSGNWTTDFRAQFLRRRGYALLPFLPTLAGIVVDNRAVSERFLWDFREAIAESVLENYAERFRTLAHEKGMKISLEGYDGTVDDLRYAGRADEPMGEFWQRPIYSGAPMCDIVEEMTSAAHVYGRPIVSAEAFTAIRGDFLDYPAVLKPLADWAFCTGINKLYLSQWVMQPYPNIAPGVSFLGFGTVFHRSQTWWPMAKAWNDYIARCQLLLREGAPVADICYITREGAPLRFTPPVPADQRGWIPDRAAYNYESCPPELLLDPRTHVENGAVVLPSGMRFRVLVLPTYNAGGQPVVQLMPGPDYHYKAAPLPKVETMTPVLLRRLKELAEAGATLVGTRPRTSPSLVDYPKCDAVLAELADAMWGRGEGFAGNGERRLGRGKVLWGQAPEAILRGAGVKPDFECEPQLAGKINYTHRRLSPGTELYFLVNKADHPVSGTVQLRSSSSSAELWWPETGASAPAPFATAKDGRTELALTLQARQSVFVLLRPTSPAAGDAYSRVVRGQDVLWPRKRAPQAKPSVGDGFTLAAWVKPLGLLPLPESTDRGWAYRDAALKAPGAGYQTYATQGEGRRGFVVGANGIVVYQYGDDGRPQPLLVYAHSMIPPNQPPLDFGNGIADGDIPSVLVAVVYEHGVTRLYLGGKLVLTAPNRLYTQPVPTRWEDARPFAADTVSTTEFEQLRPTAERAPTAAPPLPALDFSTGELSHAGSYTVVTRNGDERKADATLPPVQDIKGDWQVEFGGRTPTTVRFDRLENWASRGEPEIKHYSGVATYRTSFAAARSAPLVGTRTYLELGDVAVMATVTLNGKALGTVWTPPYRVDATDAVNWGGPNELEIRVANLWVNRLIGDAALPPDGKYAVNGALKEWPAWIREGGASPTGRQSFTTRLVWRAGDPLVKSGLLGPVRLVTVKKIRELTADR